MGLCFPYPEHLSTAQGNWPGGRTAYGYRWLPDERQWLMVPEEAVVVRRVYDLYVKNRIGIDAIAAGPEQGRCTYP